MEETDVLLNDYVIMNSPYEGIYVVDEIEFDNTERAFKFRLRRITKSGWERHDYGKPCANSHGGWYERRTFRILTHKDIAEESIKAINASMALMRLMDLADENNKRRIDDKRSEAEGPPGEGV